MKVEVSYCGKCYEQGWHLELVYPCGIGAKWWFPSKPTPRTLRKLKKWMRSVYKYETRND